MYYLLQIQQDKSGAVGNWTLVAQCDSFYCSSDVLNKISYDVGNEGISEVATATNATTTAANAKTRRTTSAANATTAAANATTDGSFARRFAKGKEH